MCTPGCGIRRYGRFGLSLIGSLMLLCAAPALASATTTISFDAPAITGSSPFGPGVTNQYQSQGVVFSSPSPVTSPVGFGQWGGLQPYLYRDPANAHSGTQVLRSWGQSGEGCFNAFAQFVGQLTTEATSLHLYAGAEVQLEPGSAPAPVELVGYDPSGNVVAEQTVNAGTKVDTPLTINTGTSDIAYFSIAVLDGQGCGTPALEIDDLTITTSATPPPPTISLVAGAPNTGPTGTPGTSITWPMAIDRFNGAEDPVTLNFSGLPTGVTATGGTTIPASSDPSQSTDVKYSIANSAPLVTNRAFTIGATTPDAASPTSVTQDFTIQQAVLIQAVSPESFVPQSNLTVPLGPCANQPISLALTTGVGVTTNTTLAISVSGDTTGFTDSLGFSSVPATNGFPSYIPLSLGRTSSGGSGNVTLTITATNPGHPSSTTTVTVQRQDVTAQGMYVTQGPQNDTGNLSPSGNGSSGNSYTGVQLVSGKRTVVRLYADANDTPGGTPGVVAQLYGYTSGGTPLPGSPIEADYGPLSSTNTPLANLPEVSGASSHNEVVSDSELEGNSNAYTFTLPYTWDGGTLYDSFDPYPPNTSIKLVGVVQQNIGETVSGGCTGSESYTLNNINLAEVGYNYGAETVPIAMSGNGVSPPPTSQVFVDEDGVTPLPDGAGGANVTPYYASVNIASIANETNGSCSAPTSSACAAQRNGDTLSALEGLDTGACCHLVGVTNGTAYGDTDGVPGYNSVVQGAGRPVTSVMHEVFHQFGLHHASTSCGGGSNGQVGVSWPPDQRGFLDGIAVNTTSEPYDFIANGLNGGGQAYDFMSYCANIGSGDRNDWVSPRNWGNLISNFGVGPAADIASVRPAAKGTGPLIARAKLNTKMLRVSAFVTPGAGLQITGVGPQVGSASPPGTAADSFTLVSRGAHGHKLKSVPMFATVGGHVDGVSPLVELSAEVPAKSVDTVQITTGGKVMAKRKRPANPPTVTIVAPAAGATVGKHSTVLVRWKTTNPGHKTLTVWLDYSQNGGKTWRTMYSGPNTRHLKLPSLFFTASKKAELRIRVSDGFNEAVAESSVFTAVGAKPQVVILNKLAAGTVVPGDSTVQLTGEAISQAGKPIAAAKLKWYLDGVYIGFGGGISSPQLPPGVDTIRFVATDPAGRTGSASMTVNVARINLPYFKYNVVSPISPTATKLQIAAVSSIPATLTVGQQPFKIGQPQGPTPVVIEITPGTKAILLEMKLTANGITTPFAALVQR